MRLKAKCIRLGRESRRNKVVAASMSVESVKKNLRK